MEQNSLPEALFDDHDMHIDDHDMHNIEELLATLEQEEKGPKSLEEQWFAAARNNDITKLKKLYTTGKIDVNMTAPNSYTALHYAVVSGDNLKAVQFLVSLPKVNVHKKDKSGNTPLYLAVYNNRHKIVTILAKASGPAINETFRNHFTMLHHAVDLGHIETVKALLKAPQIDVDAHDNIGKTPYDLATKFASGNVDEIMAILYIASLGQSLRAKHVLSGDQEYRQEYLNDLDYPEDIIKTSHIKILQNPLQAPQLLLILQ